jgi:argininosuccinate lyase
MKMWDGRFAKPSDRLMEEFNNSLPIDQRLAHEDIAGSIAWANALARIGVLSGDERDAIVTGLEKIRQRLAEGTIHFQPNDEDIHMAVERLLTEEIGTPAAKLHTGRSRNDQVATDFRLFVKNALTDLSGHVINLQRVLLARAESDAEIIVPGYTHLQQAQPVSLAHYWLSFFFLLGRELRRCENAIRTADLMPLGSGAVAGCGFQVDRQALATELGFAAVSDNSMDGVGARDFVLEALAAIASLGITLSRYAEDLIIWSSREFQFVELDDAWSTGSSMMPQKKNPDSLELIRGKSGRFLGNYTRFATTLKGVGLTYYKDLQEDKEPLLDSVHQMQMVLQVFSAVVQTLTVNCSSIEQRLDPFLLATDLADYLVRKNVPFRAAHKVIGRIVAYCIEKKVALNKMSVKDLQSFDAAFGEDVLAVFDWKTALAGRDVPGGTGPTSVARQIETARAQLAANR